MRILKKKEKLRKKQSLKKENKKGQCSKTGEIKKRKLFFFNKREQGKRAKTSIFFEQNKTKKVKRPGKHMWIETRKQEEKKETTDEQMDEQKGDTKR